MAATAAIAATCTVLAPAVVQQKTIAVTLASTVIGVGGRGDADGSLLKNKLGGSFINPGNDTYVPIKYSASVWPVGGLTMPTLNTSVAEGSSKLDSELANHTNGDIVIVGYSLGAVAVNKSREKLRDSHPANPDGTPDPHISFVMIANANRPNGGILARFPGLYIPFLDISFNGPVGPDQFKTLDITNEYDPYGDFPAYFNPLALANTLAAVQYTHPDQYYDGTDPNNLPPGSRVTQVGNTKYVIVPSKHLPLLQPIRDFTDQFGASFVLDAIEPTLRVFVDMAYDRETSPGTAKPFSFFTPPKNIIDALNKLPGAIEEGAHNFENGLSGATPKQQSPASDPAKTPASPSDTKPKAPEVPLTAPKTPDQVLTLTTPQPVTPHAPPAAPEPTTIAVGAITPATPTAPDAATATSATSGAGSAPAQVTGSKAEAKPDEKAAPTAKDVDKSKDSTKPTLRLPKIPASQPGATPKTAKLPSIRDSLKSIPGLGISKAPSTTGGSTDTNTGTTKGTSDTGNTTGSGPADHTTPSDHTNSGDHSNSGGSHSGSNAA
ncbi:MAG: PE-PPE domain-containing protein [Mycobacterium sp.]